MHSFGFKCYKAHLAVRGAEMTLNQQDKEA